MGLGDIIIFCKVGYVCDVNSDAVAKGLTSFFVENRTEEFRANILEEKKRFQWDYFAIEIQELASQVG